MREIIEAVRQAIPDASSRPPGAVLEHVLSALRQADAKLAYSGRMLSGSQRLRRVRANALTLLRGLKDGLT